MKEVIKKWLDNQKIKYEKLYCKHDWKIESRWNTRDAYTGVKKENAIMLYVCKKCGEFNKIELF